MPGGFTKVDEKLEDSVKREVLEESRYIITDPELLFVQNNKKYPYVIGIIYKARTIFGNEKNSWEGKFHGQNMQI